MEHFTTSTGDVILVHEGEGCRGPCPIHNPSNHHMRDWPLVWRDDRDEAMSGAMLMSVLSGVTDSAVIANAGQGAWWDADAMGLHGWLERVCPHGIGHPDLDSVRFGLEFYEEMKPRAHAQPCDGCCAPPTEEGGHA